MWHKQYYQERMSVMITQYFKKYYTTKRDGYTGLITKLVFELPLGVDSPLQTI